MLRFAIGATMLTKFALGRVPWDGRALRDSRHDGGVEKG